MKKFIKHKITLKNVLVDTSCCLQQTAMIVHIGMPAEGGTNNETPGSKNI
jgi:hypothetical protein